MATIVTRSGKGSPLTNTEVDSNFTNLNTDKVETGGTGLTKVGTTLNVDSAQPGITSLGTLTSLTVDSITINGNEIDLASGDLIVDAPNDIYLNADGGQVFLQDGSSLIGALSNENNGDYGLVSFGQDKDLILRGNDGGSYINALTLDMSEAGKAIFNAGASFSNNVSLGDSNVLNIGAGDDLQLYHNSSNSVIANQTGHLYLVNGADDTDIIFMNDDGSGGTTNYFVIDGGAETVISEKPFIANSTVEINGGVLDIKNSGSQSEVRLYCESSNAHYAALKAPAHADFSGDITLTLPASTGTLLSTANSDAPTTTTSSGDADFVLVDDGGVMKKITPANLGIGGSGTLTVQDEGSALSTEATTLNFVGAGVTASGTGAVKTITISGGGSSSGGGTTAQTWGASLAGKLQLYNSSSNNQNVLISSPSGATSASEPLSNYTGSGGTIIGNRAGEDLTSGSNNTLIGYFAGGNTTTGEHNTYVGFQAGGGPDTETRNVAIGSYAASSGGMDYSVIVGYNAGRYNGDYSTSVGYYAGYGLYYWTGQNYSTSIGRNAGANNYNNNAYNNVNVGYYAGNTIRTGDYNTFLGGYANTQSSSTSLCVAIGYGAKANSSSVSIGYGSQDSGNSGSTNTVTIGYNAGYDMDGGDYSIYVGYRAGYGGGTGSYNIAVGSDALYDIDSGANNIAIGHTALNETTTGSDNIAIGYQAGKNITTAEKNLFIGYNAGLAAAGNPANANTGVGYESLKAITGGGAANTGFGYNSLLNVTTGDYNTSLGYHCADGVSTGSSNIAVGHYANCGNSDANISMGFYSRAYSYSISIGYEAAKDSTSAGQANVSIGYRAGQQVSGDRNVFIGGNAGRGGSSVNNASNGDENVGVGEFALANLSNGEYNVGLGTSALSSITSADYTVGIGRNAGTGAQTSSSCVFIGKDATGPNGAQSQVSIGNASRGCKWGVSIGTQAGGDTFSSNTSTFNVLIGYRAGYEITGDDNTGIGPYALYNDSTSTAYSGDNLTCIGYKAIPSAIGVSNEITLGNSSVATLRCQVTSITALSDQRDKTAIEDLDLGLKFVNAMKPRKFTWNRRDGKWVGKKELGFIAQELHELEMDFSSTERTRLVNYENPSRLEAQPMNTYPILVKAIQELSAKVDSLQAEITKLKGE